MKLFKYNKITLNYEKVKPYKFIPLFCVIFFIGWVCNYNQPLHKTITEEEKLIIIKEFQNQFSQEKLINKLKELNFKFPYIVLAQAKLESGNFTSNIFKENHNLFGLKEAKQRITTSLGTENNHAYYDSYTESILDYAFYQCKYLSGIKTEDQYFQYLSQSYAEDTTYIGKLKSIIQKENLKSLFEN